MIVIPAEFSYDEVTAVEEREPSFCASMQSTGMSPFRFRIRDLLAVMVACAILLAILAMQPWLSTEDREYLRRAAQFEQADVSADVQSAIRRSDPRFLGVYGVGLFVPGVPKSIESGLLQAPGRLRIIPETTDALTSSAHARYVQAAEAYAAKYNSLLCDRLGRP